MSLYETSLKKQPFETYNGTADFEQKSVFLKNCFDYVDGENSQKTTYLKQENENNKEKQYTSM